MDFYSHSQTQAFFRDRLTRYGVLVSVLVNASLWLVVGIAMRQLPDFASLHYTIYFGIDWIGPRYYLLWLPAISAALLVVNTALSLPLYAIEKMLAYFLVSGAVLVQVVAVISLSFILFINF